MPFPSYFPLVLTLFAVNHFTDIHALREVSGVLNVHHSLNLTRMHYHMRFWKEELSSLPPSLAELPRLMLEHKRGELAMLTRTLLKESRLDPAVFPSIQDQTPIKVQYASLFFVIIFPACPSLSPPALNSKRQILLHVLYRLDCLLLFKGRFCSIPSPSSSSPPPPASQHSELG